MRFEKGMKSRRNTGQRQVIMEELSKSASHPTAGELFELVRKRLPRISLGTVYRNLDVLSKTGVIKRLETSGREARFDAVQDQHHHVRCSRCGRVSDLVEPPVIEVGGKVEVSNGWEIHEHRIEFIGICPECRG